MKIHPRLALLVLIADGLIVWTVAMVIHHVGWL